MSTGMRTLPAFVLVLAALPVFADSRAPEPLKFSVIVDERTFTRPEGDHRCCVWTDDSAHIGKFFAALGIKAEATPLKKGQILAAFFNDRITEDFLGVMWNANNEEIFADYADSGMMFKLGTTIPGVKYSHLTVVLVDAPKTPSKWGIRGIVPDVTSEEFPGGAAP